MATALIGLIALTAVAVVSFGIAGLVDNHRRHQEHQQFLRGSLRQAVVHTASLPVGPNRRRALRVQAMPLLTDQSYRLLEESGVYPAA